MAPKKNPASSQSATNTTNPGGRGAGTPGAVGRGAGVQGAGAPGAVGRGAGVQGAGAPGAVGRGAGGQGAGGQGAGGQGAGGQGAGAKRPASRNSPSPTPPSVASSPGSIPSRPGSSGGYHLNNFSYSQVDATGKETAIDSDEVEFRLVADAYYIGWQRFNHADTKKALIHLGKECAAAWTSPVNKTKYGGYRWPGEVDKIDTYLENFLNGLRTTTPAILKRAMTPGEGETYAMCQLEPTYKGSVDSVLATRSLFYLIIFNLLPVHLLDAYEKHEDDRYQELRMTIATSLFHELCHGWVYFLMGPVTHESLQVGTPPEFKAAWDQADELGSEVGEGESGYYIESLIFGATLDFDPWLKPLGATTVQSRLECVNADLARRVVPASVAKEFNKNPKGCDIKTKLKGLFTPAAAKQTAGRAAKKQKRHHANVNRGSKCRRHAWHLIFEYNSDHSVVTGLKKTAVVNPV